MARPPYLRQMHVILYITAPVALASQGTPRVCTFGPPTVMARPPYLRQMTTFGPILTPFGGLYRGFAALLGGFRGFQGGFWACYIEDYVHLT